MTWLDLARELVALLVRRLEAADDMRAEKRDGKTIMPPFEELGGHFDDRAFARELLRVACKADKRIAEAIVVVASTAKGVDHDTLRELVSVIPTDAT